MTDLVLLRMFETDLRRTGIMTHFRTVGCLLVVGGTIVSQAALSDSVVFPGRTWESREPAQLGLKADRLDELAALLGGRGCVIKNGYVVRAWATRRGLRIGCHPPNRSLARCFSLRSRRAW